MRLSQQTVQRAFDEIAQLGIDNKFWGVLTIVKNVKKYLKLPTSIGTMSLIVCDKNGVQNDLSHIRGVVSMARRGSNPETYETMNSASSQFFIVQADSPHLDGNYAAFGKVLSGLEVVDEIASVQTDENDRPLKEVVINTIRFKEGE